MIKLKNLLNEQQLNESFGDLKELLQIIEIGEKIGVIDDRVIREIKKGLIQGITQYTKNLPQDKQSLVKEIIKTIESARDAKSFRSALLKVEKIGSTFNEGFIDENQKIKSLLRKGKDWWTKNSYSVIQVMANLVVHFIFGVLEGLLKTKLGRPKINFGGKGKFGSGGAGSGGKF